MAYSVHVDSSASFDAEYRFGRPHVYLTPQEIARVLIARSRLGDTRANRVAESIEPAARRSVTPGLRFTPDGQQVMFEEGDALAHSCARSVDEHPCSVDWHSDRAANH